MNAKQAILTSDKIFNNKAKTEYSDAISIIDLEIAKAVNGGYGAVYIFKEAVTDYEDRKNFLEKYYKRLGYRFWPGPQNLLFCIHWDDSKEVGSPSEKYNPEK